MTKISLVVYQPAFISPYGNYMTNAPCVPVFEYEPTFIKRPARLVLDLRPIPMAICPIPRNPLAHQGKLIVNLCKVLLRTAPMFSIDLALGMSGSVANIFGEIIRQILQVDFV